MNSISEKLQLYSVSHQNPVNQQIHKICVPLISLSLIGLLQEVPSPVDVSWILITGALIYYASFRNLKVLIVAILQISVMVILLSQISHHRWQIFSFIFVLAWIGQFIGHHVEGKRPSFLQDLQFLLIGPLWILHPLVKY